MTGVYDLGRRAAAEFLGTALLLATVIGSGIMGAHLSGGNAALTLLCNTLPTGAILTVLILIFGPICGAHFNPLVTLVFALRRDMRWKAALAYLPAQLSGAVAGVYTAHLMFAQPLLQLSTRMRDGAALDFSEFVATFGLIGTILGAQKFRAETTPLAVGLYIVAAYWFTASTSFANPAVTIARTLSNSFAGIAPSSAPAFIVAQLAGALAALVLFNWLLEPRQARQASSES